MHIHRVIHVTAALLLTAACTLERASPRTDAPAERAADPAHEVGPEEYAVLSALLRAEVLEEDRSYLLISDRTQKAQLLRTDPGPEEIAAKLRLPVSVIHDYNRPNARGYPLRPAFLPGSGTEMMTAARVDSLLPGETYGAAWTAFAQRHPGSAGLALVSRVAFTPDGRTAVASYTVVCGGLCGQAALVRLDRDADGWKVTANAGRMSS